MIAELTKTTKKDQYNYLSHIVRTHNMSALTYNQIKIGVQTIIRNVDSVDEMIEGIKSGKYDVINLAGKDYYRVSNVLVTYFRNE